MVLKLKPKLNSKFMLKGSQTIKIMNRSKNRGGLIQVKAVFCIKRNKKYRYIMTARKSTLQNIVSSFGVRSEYRQKYKINCQRTFKRLHNCAIYRKDCKQKCCIKKLFIKIPQYSQENTCVGVSFHLCWSPCNFIKKRLQRSCFPVNIGDIQLLCRTPPGDCFQKLNLKTFSSGD